MIAPKIFIDREANLEAPDDDSFSRWVAAALASTDKTWKHAPEVSLRINDVDEMTALNTTYRQKAGATNVLSFPAELPEEVDSDLLGDIVICAPVVIREATEQDKSLDSHWAHMTVHGVLHLLGFDHVEDADAEIMERLEIQTLHSLGFDNPYETITDPHAAMGDALQ